MPSCDAGLCWYVFNEVQTINQSEYDFFVVDGVAHNARQADTAPDAYI